MTSKMVEKTFLQNHTRYIFESGIKIFVWLMFRKCFIFRVKCYVFVCFFELERYIMKIACDCKSFFWICRVDKRVFLWKFMITLLFQTNYKTAVTYCCQDDMALTRIVDMANVDCLRKLFESRNINKNEEAFFNFKR